MKKLPDAEFDVMKVVWANHPPLSAATIMKQHGHHAGWKVQTAITLLLRLVERGFLRTEKVGNERIYFPLVKQDDYLKFETAHFIKQYHKNSFLNLVAMLHGDDTLTDDDVNGLRKLLNERGN